MIIKISEKYRDLNS